MLRRDFPGPVLKSPRRIGKDGAELAAVYKCHEILNGISGWLIVHSETPVAVAKVVFLYDVELRRDPVEVFGAYLVRDRPYQPQIGKFPSP
jgi:hypothetical protein